MPVPTIFTALAMIFVALAVRDYLVTEGKLTPRRFTWIRLALIFGGIAIALELGRMFWG